MKNPIVRHIFLWLAETTLASVLEAFLVTVIYVWNQCVATYNIPLGRFHVKSLYETSSNTNAPETEELIESVGDSICGNLIVLDEEENTKSENEKYPKRETCEDILTSDSDERLGNAKHPIRETCEDLLTFDSAIEFGRFQIQDPVTYDLLVSEHPKPERDYEQAAIIQNAYSQSPLRTRPQVDPYTARENADVCFNEQTPSGYAASAEITQGNYEFNTGHDYDFNGATSETRDAEFFLNYGDANDPDFINQKRKPVRSIYYQSRKESPMVVNKEVLVRRKGWHDYTSPFREYEISSEIRRNKHYYDNYPAFYSELQLFPPNSELFDVNRRTSNKEGFFELCEASAEEVKPLLNLWPHNFDSMKYSMTERGTSTKYTNLGDMGSSITSGRRQSKGNKKVHFNTSVETFIYEPNLSIRENFNLGEEILMGNESVDNNHSENRLTVEKNEFADKHHEGIHATVESGEFVDNSHLGNHTAVENSESADIHHEGNPTTAEHSDSVNNNHKVNHVAVENSNFVWPSASIPLDRPHDTANFMEKWITGEEAFHQLITEDPREYKMRYFEKIEIEDTIEIPREKIKSPPITKGKKKTPQRRNSWTGFLRYSKSGEYCKNLTLPSQKMKLDPKSWMNKIKKQLFKK